MPQFEKVSINTATPLSDIMNMKSTTTDLKPAAKLPKKSVVKNSGKKSLNKEQIDAIMRQGQIPIQQTAAQQTESKYSSKENKLNIKEDRVMRILNYQNSARFGGGIRKELKFNYTRDQLMKKSIDQIDNVLYRIRNYLNNRGMDGIYEQMVRTSAMGYEKVVSEFYEIEGFSEMLMQNPAFWDAFERWKIERTLPDIPPSLQLMYIVGSTTLLAHMKNNAIIEKPIPKKPIPKDIIDNTKKTNLKLGAKLS